MKKITLSILLMFALGLSLAGCGGPNSRNGQDETTVGDTTQAAANEAETTTQPDASEPDTTVPETTAATQQPDASTTQLSSTGDAYPQTREFMLSGIARTFALQKEYPNSVQYKDEYGIQLIFSKENPSELESVSASNEALAAFCRAHPRSPLTEEQIKAKAQEFAAQRNDMQYFPLDEDSYRWRPELNTMIIRFRQQYNGNKTLNTISMKLNQYGDIISYRHPASDPLLYERFKVAFSSVDYEKTDRQFVQKMMEKTGLREDQIHIGRMGLSVVDNKPVVVYSYSDASSPIGNSAINIEIS